MAAQLAGQARLLRSGGAQFVHLRGMRLESLPRELTAELSTSASLLNAAPAATHAPFHTTYTPVAPAPSVVERHAPVRVRLDLQQRAATNLRRHALRAVRRLLDRIVARVLPYRHQAAATLFVGPAEECREAMKSQAFAGAEYRSVGFVDSHIPPAPESRGQISDFPRLLHDANAEAVVVCGYLSDTRFGDVVDAALAAQCQLLSAPRAIDIAGVAPKVMWRGGQPVIELTTPSLKGWQLALKRVMDVISSTLGLVLVAPVMAVIAAASKLDSPGPVLFTQDRVGFGGRRFRMIKFRTMRNGADGEKQALAHLNHTGDSRLFKIPNDPRVTKLGAMLRRWSLDELPQLLNVFVGDMALVGPRPFFEADLHTYEDRHFRRLGAKPGITGLWQVRGRSAVVDFEEVVRLDREYIEHWTVWSDLQILALTPGAVLRRRGAY